MWRLYLDSLIPIALAAYGTVVLQTSHAVPPYGARSGTALLWLLCAVALYQARIVHGRAD